jgi:hypothetical protein
MRRPPCERRKGVKVGDNYVEQMAAESPQAQGSGKFEAASTSAEAFSAQGKTGAALAAASRRQDILTAFKYSGSRASSSDEPACYATTSQLAFPPVAGRGSGAPEHPRRVQDCLWAGSKFVDARVPRSVSQRTRGAARQHRLEEEQGRSPFQTVEKVRRRLLAVFAPRFWGASSISQRSQRP